MLDDGRLRQRLLQGLRQGIIGSAKDRNHPGWVEHSFLKDNRTETDAMSNGDADEAGKEVSLAANRIPNAAFAGVLKLLCNVLGGVVRYHVLHLERIHHLIRRIRRKQLLEVVPSQPDFSVHGLDGRLSPGYRSGTAFPRRSLSGETKIVQLDCVVCLVVFGQKEL
eukprot:scaffold2048_cov224-Pinguiococcus_pyrenoidosus.AAC.4